MNKNFVALIFPFLALPLAGPAQADVACAVPYEVNRVYPSVSVTREALTGARTLTDLNARYQESWVKEYVSVEVRTSHQSRTRKSVSKNDILSQEQKANLLTADLGTEISIRVQYMPENTLKHNDVQTLDFKFTVDPESPAQYSGGQNQLNQYLMENAIDKIPNGSFTGYDLAAVKFSINETGQVVDASLFWSSDDEKTDALLLETIRNMPDWKPATYSDGTKVKQDFVFTVGNMENCAVPLLNLRKS
jgi:hypothetical protein